MKYRAFSLVELLVVIAVIGMVLNILLPGLNLAKKSSQKVVCLSNQRQIGISLSTYINEYQKFPYAFDDSQGLIFYADYPFLGDPLMNRRGKWWIDFLSSYNDPKARDIFWCPSRKINDDKLKNNLLHANYGVNLDVCIDYPTRLAKDKGAVSLNAIPHPDKTLMLLDSGYSIVNWQTTMNNRDNFFPNKQVNFANYIPGISNNSAVLSNTESTCQRTDAVNSRHYQNKNNALFCDGHVESNSPDSVQAETNSSGNYKSPRYLWLPK